MWFVFHMEWYLYVRKFILKENAHKNKNTHAQCIKINWLGYHYEQKKKKKTQKLTKQLKT